MKYELKYNNVPDDKNDRFVELLANIKALLEGKPEPFSFPSEQSENSEAWPKYGDKVMCSNDPDYKEYWLGLYIGKHPNEDSHIVLLRARPKLKIKNEQADVFYFCKKKDYA